MSDKMSGAEVLAMLGRAAGYILCTAGSEHADYRAMHDATDAVAALIEREAALAARVAELEADAARYQLLRDAEKCRTLSAGRTGLILGNFGEDLDAAIDAARAESGND